MKDDFSTAGAPTRPLNFLEEPKRKTALSLLGEEKPDYDPKPTPILNGSHSLQPYNEEIRNLLERQGGYHDVPQVLFDVWRQDPLYASAVVVVATASISASLIHSVYNIPILDTCMKLPDILNGLTDGHNIDNIGHTLASLYSGILRATTINDKKLYTNVISLRELTSLGICDFMRDHPDLKKELYPQLSNTLKMLGIIDDSLESLLGYHNDLFQPCRIGELETYSAYTHPISKFINDKHEKE